MQAKSKGIGARILPVKCRVKPGNYLILKNLVLRVRSQITGLAVIEWMGYWNNGMLAPVK